MQPAKVTWATRRRRLLRLAQFLEHLPKGGKFDMGTWAEHPAADHAPVAAHTCGTTACALGWAAMIPSFRREGLKLEWDRAGYCVAHGERDHCGPWSAEVWFGGYEGEFAAEAFFGLTFDEAVSLFLGKGDRQGVIRKIKALVNQSEPAR